MKRKYMTWTIIVVLLTALLGGCAGKGNSSDSGDTLYGQITEVGEDSITIQLGTLKEQEASEQSSSEQNSAEASGDATANADENATGNVAGGGEQPSLLDLSDEKREISVADDTVIEQQSQMPGGGAPDASGDASAPEQPSGGAPDENGNGSAPEKPDGQAPDASGDASAPEQPSGEAPDGNGSGSAPEKPDGQAPDASGDASAPEKPSGEAPNGNGQAPDASGNANASGDAGNGQAQEIALSDLSVGDTVKVTLDDDGEAESIVLLSGGFGRMQQASGVDSYAAVTEYESDTQVDGESYTSTGTDENAIHILSGAAVSLSNILVSRTSDDSTGGDNSSFYGVGAAVLNTDGTAYVDNATIDTDAAGGAGLFAYGSGTIYAADSKITTAQDTSGGIHVAGGGSLYAWDLDVETQGESAAAIRSDRGGGTMRVEGGSYTSNGSGSPAIYSTADIAVKDADLTANGSEAVCIEGQNSVRLFSSDLTGNMSEDSRNDCIWNVILYQSMSGDSEEGNSTFEMDGGTLTAKNGGMFYTTNTQSTITLKDVDITASEDNPFFLRCTGNQNERGWGTSGSNGADCLFTAIDQSMQGDVVWDSISQLDFYCTKGSHLTGAVVQDESCAGTGGDGYCKLVLDSDSVWTVTGDSTLTSLCSEGTIEDSQGRTVTIQGSDGTVYVEGDSSYTITVDSYEDTADVSGASTIADWSEYAQTKPEEL